MKILLQILLFFPILTFGQSLQNTDTIPTIEFYLVENKPEFPGGESELLKYFSTNLKYPEFEKDCIFSKIRFTFIIDTIGKIINPEVKINECMISDTYKKELINLIENMPNWTPGENKGKKVNVKFFLPLNIDLKY